MSILKRSREFIWFNNSDQLTRPESRTVAILLKGWIGAYIYEHFLESEIYLGEVLDSVVF